LAFDRALSAAVNDGKPAGEAEVCLAKGSFLVALDRHGAAGEMLDRADRVVAGLLTGNGPRSLRRLAAAIQRTRAEALVQQAAYREAKLAVEEGGAAGGGLPRRRSGIACAPAGRRRGQRAGSRELADRTALRGRAGQDRDDGSTFRGYLGLSEVARRRSQWDSARGYLRDAAKRHDGDAWRLATVQFRMAQTAWHQSRASNDPDRGQLAETAVMHAAEALRTFQRIGNPVGIVRARCALVRGLVTAGRPAAAGRSGGCRPAGAGSGQQGRRRQAPAARLPDPAGAGRGAAGSRRQPDTARVWLAEAAAGFERAGDWWSEADTKVLLGTTLRSVGRHHEAPWQEPPTPTMITSQVRATELSASRSLPASARPSAELVHLMRR
jgi:hypothetical protein